MDNTFFTLRKFLSFAFAIFASILALWLTFYGVDWNELIYNIAKIQIPTLIYLSLLNGFFIVLRAFRWQILLRRIKNIPLFTVLQISQVGAFLNNVLPLRIGEVIRAIVLKKRYQLSGAEVIGNIILERMLDLIAIVFLIYFVLITNTIPIKFNATIQYAMKIVGFGIGGILVIAMFMKVKLKKNTELAVGWKGLLFRVSNGINGLYDWKTSLPAFGFSLAMWITSATTILLFSPLSHGSINLLNALVVTILIAIGVTIPAAPGFVGTYHLFCKIGLVAFGVDPEYAVAIAVVTHFMSFFWNNVIGFISMFLLKISWQDINIFRKESDL
ncbi:MAG: flippase-like domain-containing protein [bacterium]|nr:flippase-like domain-containing protein [bacterium]